MASLTEPQRAFLNDNPFVGIITTLRRDGSPHSTVVWVDVDGDDVLVNTARGRVKERNIARDPRVSLAVVDPEDTYRWVAVTGRAVLEDDGADAHIDKLSRKYLGTDYPWRSTAGERVIARITVDRVDARGLDE
jgi:PPOX class probable F420-dependent enzyme